MNLALPSSLAGQGLLWFSWEVRCSLAPVLGVRAKLDTVRLAPTLSPTLPRSMCELGRPCPNLAAYRRLLMKGLGAESSACGQGAKQKPSVTLAQHTVYSFLGAGAKTGIQAASVFHARMKAQDVKPNCCSEKFSHLLKIPTAHKCQRSASPQTGVSFCTAHALTLCSIVPPQDALIYS